MTKPAKIVQIDCRESAYQNHEACLQYRSTVATEDGALQSARSSELSQYALLLSALAFIALLITIFQGRSALNKSQKANLISEDTSKRQLRAYVVTRDIGFQWSVQLPIGQKVCSLWVNLQNAGLTPTRDLTLVAGFDVDLSADIFEKVKYDPTSQTSVLGPGSTLRTPVLVIPFEIVDSVFKGHSKLLLFGAAFYKDVFDVPRETRFCFEVTFSKARDSEHPDSINWIVTGNHNCSDEECGVIQK